MTDRPIAVNLTGTTSAAAAAVRAAVSDQRWDDLGRLADQHFFAISIASPDTWESAWAAVPDAWLAEHPRHRLADAWTRAIARTGDVIDEEAERKFTRRMLQTREPEPQDAVRVHLMVLRRDLSSGRIARANDAATDAQRELRRADEREPADLVDIGGITWLNIGLARFLAGDLVLAADAWAEGWRCATQAGVEGDEHPLAPYLAGHCALAHALGGVHAEASLWLSRAATAERDSHPVFAQRIGAAGVLAKALVAIARLDQRAAEATLQAMDRRPPSAELSWIEVHARVRVALLWGQQVDGIASLDSFLDDYPSLTAPSSLAGAVLRADLSDLHQSLGDLVAAERLVEPVLGFQVQTFVTVAAARLLMTRGRADEATALLDRLRPQSGQLWRDQPHLDVLRANIAHLARTRGRGPLIIAAALSIQSNRAFDAAFDALPHVYDVMSQRAEMPEASAARFVPPPLVALTPREKQILAALEAHRAVHDIAEALHISYNTAKTHLRALYRKLGVSTRADALEMAARFL